MTAWSFPTLNALAFPGDPAGSWPDRPWPLPVVLDGAGAAGFELVELVDLDRASVGDARDEVGELLAARGLRCSEVGVLCVGADGAGALAVAADLAELGRASRASCCVAVLDTDVDTAVGVLAACAEPLHEAGLRLALEFVPYTPLRTIRDARAVCEKVGWDRCGVLVDSWMFFRSGASWADLAALDAGEVAAVQLCDAGPMVDDLVTESRHRRTPPGQGDYDLVRFLAELRSLPYRGPVSIELLSSELRRLPPAVQADIAMRSLRPFDEETS